MLTTVASTAPFPAARSFSTSRPMSSSSFIETASLRVNGALQGHQYRNGGILRQALRSHGEKRLHCVPGVSRFVAGICIAMAEDVPLLMVFEKPLHVLDHGSGALHRFTQAGSADVEP